MSNIQTVLNAFLEKIEIEKHTPSRSLKYTNETLYSYSLPIAKWISINNTPVIVVHNHTVKGLGFISKSTSKHVNQLIRLLYSNDIDHRVINDLDEDDRFRTL
jgi:hypothetical protein